jgi:hypothetical protein
MYDEQYMQSKTKHYVSTTDGKTRLPPWSDMYSRKNRYRSYTLSGCLTFIDTDRERKIGLGTTYNFSAMSEGRCLVNYQMAETLQVKENDIVYMRLNMYQNLLTLVDVYNS